MEELQKVREQLLAKLKKLVCQKFVVLRRVRVRYARARLEAVEICLKG